VNTTSESNEIARLRRRIRCLLITFIVGLVLSGVTAFPLLTELNMLCAWFGLPPDARPDDHAGLSHWLLLVREGLAVTYVRYPFLAYGTDWLAFGHIVIALFFIAPAREPGRHLSVIDVGIVACVLVIPLALICGPIRGIPFYWQLIDCSFGVVGVIPLLFVKRLSLRLNLLTPQT
jgi:hypothetical protein